MELGNDVRLLAVMSQAAVRGFGNCVSRDCLVVVYSSTLPGRGSAAEARGPVQTRCVCVTEGGLWKRFVDGTECEEAEWWHSRGSTLSLGVIVPTETEHTDRSVHGSHSPFSLRTALPTCDLVRTDRQRLRWSDRDSSGSDPERQGCRTDCGGVDKSGVAAIQGLNIMLLDNMQHHMATYSSQINLIVLYLIPSALAAVTRTRKTGP